MYFFANIRACLAASLIGLAALLTGCASLPTPENSQAGVVGVDMVQQTTTPLGIKVERMRYALIFVRLDDQGNIPSTSEWRFGNFLDDHWYLLNAKPGHWVVVGTSFLDQGLVVDTKMATLFPEAMVRASQVELKPGKAAYMGRFQILEAPDVDEMMDPVQNHYLSSVLAGELRMKREDILDNIAMDFKSVGGALSVQYKGETGETTKKTGLENMKRALGAPWASRFD